MTIEISPDELRELLEQLLRQSRGSPRPRRNKPYKILIDAKTLSESWKSNGNNWHRSRN